MQRLAGVPVAPGSTVLVRGTGSIGMRHLCTLQSLGGFRPVALPVRSERTEELKAAGFEVATGVTDAAAATPGASIVCTDTSRHIADALELLAHGPVLIEKPLAAVGAQLLPLLERPEAHERVAVAFPFRFDEALHRFRQLLPRIGAVHAVLVECASYLPDWRPDRDYRESYSARADEGGVLRDLSHELDYAVWAFGAPRSVRCRMSTGRLGIEADEQAELWWRAPGGAAVTVRLDYLTRGTRRRMVADGSEGTLVWDAVAGRVELTLPGSAPLVETLIPNRDAVLLRQADAFLNGRGADRLCTLEEGARIVALADAARRAADSGLEEPVS